MLKMVMQTSLAQPEFEKAQPEFENKADFGAVYPHSYAVFIYITCTKNIAFWKWICVLIEQNQPKRSGIATWNQGLLF